MKNILVLGAGRTAFYLVNYLLEQGKKYNWTLRLGDREEENLTIFRKESDNFTPFLFDVMNEQQACEEVKNADVVISLLPAQFHEKVGALCLKFEKHFLSASYVSPEFKSWEKEIADKGLYFIKETGLDPGLDHMSAVQMLDDIRSKGGTIDQFLSFTGGLMSPSQQGNPWQYKFTWNPMYVVTAGRDGGNYLREGQIKRIPYHRLFEEIDFLDMPGYGSFDAYYNRNSFKYVKEYGLESTDTVIRYTLRRQGFCKAWAVFVSLGLTDNNFEFDFDEPLTNRSFLNMFIRKGEESLEDRFCKAAKCQRGDEVYTKIEWLGMFDETEIPIKKGTSAVFLKEILSQKWAMLDTDKDMIYMAHVCYYQNQGRLFKKKHFLAVEGENKSETAMAQTVGLPLAMAAKLVLLDKLGAPGLMIPNRPDLYQPILAELKERGVGFQEIEEELTYLQNE